MDKCIFCDIASKKIASKVVCEDNDIFAFEDINPVAPVHILIVPKKHIPSVANLGPQDYNLIAGIFEAANKIAKEKGLTDSGFRILSNHGSSAGQSVFHLHFHLLGGRPMLWPPG